MEFIKRLNERNLSKDKAILNAWENDQISTRIAKSTFLSRYGSTEYITDEEFELWMNSLGYYNSDTIYRCPYGYRC